MHKHTANLPFLKDGQVLLFLSRMLYFCTLKNKAMIIQKTREEIELMRESALIVSKTLGMIAAEIKPGVTTLHLDKLAEEFIRDHGAVPGFLGLYGCPSTLLTSVNEQVVHGLPTSRPIEEGDIVSVDCGAIKMSFTATMPIPLKLGKWQRKPGNYLK